MSYSSATGETGGGTMKYLTRMASRLSASRMFFAIAQIASYVPGGARSFWMLIG